MKVALCYSSNLTYEGHLGMCVLTKDKALSLVIIHIAFYKLVFLSSLTDLL